MATEQQQGGFFGKIKKLLGIGGDADEYVEDRRAASRLDITIPVQVERTAQSWEGGTLNLSPIGLFVETDAAPMVGTQVKLSFDGIGKDSPAVQIVANVVRLADAPKRGLGLSIDRDATGHAGMQAYRELVFHYRRHPPLLEQKRAGIREARCPECSWVGRVMGQTSNCPRCGHPKLEEL